MNEEIYKLLQQQNAAMAAMIDRYQHEIIPQYERTLELFQAERETLIKAAEKVGRENAELQKKLEEVLANE